MSVSMKSTKAQMYSEIEMLRARCDRLEQQLRAAPAPKFTTRAPTRSEAAIAYCKHHNVTSVSKQQLDAWIMQ